MIAAAIAVVVFGLRVVRSLTRHEPEVSLSGDEPRQDAELQALLERTRGLADARPMRIEGPTTGAPCQGAPIPGVVSWRHGDNLSHALRLHLATAGQGAAIEFLDEVPFEAPPPMAFPPDEQLQLTVLAWQDPTRLRGGSVRAVVALRDRTADVVRCRADVDIRIEDIPGASIDGARFDLLWMALRQGASRLRAMP